MKYRLTILLSFLLFLGVSFISTTSAVAADFPETEVRIVFTINKPKKDSKIPIVKKTSTPSITTSLSGYEKSGRLPMTGEEVKQMLLLLGSFLLILFFLVKIYQHILTNKEEVYL